MELPPGAPSNPTCEPDSWPPTAAEVLLEALGIETPDIVVPFWLVPTLDLSLRS